MMLKFKSLHARILEICSDIIYILGKEERIYENEKKQEFVSKC